MVAGDFNFPDINWYHSGGVCKNKGRPSSLDFLDCLNKNYLTQHVLEPTFKDNILDLVLTDDPARIFRVSHGPPLGLTEKNCLHSSIRWSYELRSNTGASAIRFSRPVYSKGNYSLFNEKILDCRDRLSSDD
ncbi:RNA-directed DNA polymerase from mobile element jockey-like, partial [Brachionus plicatilis]